MKKLFDDQDEFKEVLKEHISYGLYKNKIRDYLDPIRMNAMKKLIYEDLVDPLSINCQFQMK